MRNRGKLSGSVGSLTRRAGRKSSYRLVCFIPSFPPSPSPAFLLRRSLPGNCCADDNAKLQEAEMAHCVAVAEFEKMRDAVVRMERERLEMAAEVEA